MKVWVYWSHLDDVNKENNLKNWQQYLQINNGWKLGKTSSMTSWAAAEGLLQRKRINDNTSIFVFQSSSSSKRVQVRADWNSARWLLRRGLRYILTAAPDTHVTTNRRREEDHRIHRGNELTSHNLHCPQSTRMNTVHRWHFSRSAGPPRLHGLQVQACQLPKRGNDRNDRLQS